jgi:hypothetical protein
VAAPSDPLALLRVGTDAELSGYAARSHLSDGRVVAWTGPAGPAAAAVAVDAEIERPVPPALAARHGTAGFWERWTRLECLAKLTGVPVVLLQRAGLAVDADPDVEVVTGRLHPEPGTTIVVSVARKGLTV